MPVDRVRRRLQGLFGAGLVLAAGRALALDELRHFDHPHLGKVTLLAPAEWGDEVRRDATTGSVQLRLIPPVKNLFDFEIVVNDLAHLQQELLTRRDLDGHVKASLADVWEQSVEGRITTQRFGLRRDESLYARLTDKQPPPGEFRIITKGVRLLGRKAMLFTLYSDDADGSVLRRALDVVSSFAFEN